MGGESQGSLRVGVLVTECQDICSNSEYLKPKVSSTLVSAPAWWQGKKVEQVRSLHLLSHYLMANRQRSFFCLCISSAEPLSSAVSVYFSMDETLHPPAWGSQCSWSGMPAQLHFSQPRWQWLFWSGDLEGIWGCKNTEWAGGRGC